MSYIFEKQNKALLIENTQLKQSIQQIKSEKEKDDEELRILRQRWHYCLIGIVILVVFLAVKIVR